MKLIMECLDCHVQQMKSAMNMVQLDDTTRYTLFQKLLVEIGSAHRDMTPPEMAQRLYDIVTRETGSEDLFAEIKKASNATALSVLKEVQSMVDTGDDPLQDALKLAASGNIIDYGARRGVTRDEILESVRHALEGDVDQHFYQSFIETAENASHILYVGDNSGEIVFDRVLLEHLPLEKVRFAVRGKPIINDATRIDAQTAGIDQVVSVLDTGDNTPGINLERSSSEFIDAFGSADMIILKGQGNLETMFKEDLKGYVKPGAKLFFILKVKCTYVSQSIGKDIGETVFMVKDGDGCIEAVTRNGCRGGDG